MTHRLIAVAALLLASTPAVAGDLIYRPVDPAFGGNPFNGAYLLDQARAQNQYDNVQPDLIDDFRRGLTARLLARASSEIENRLFGENPEASGSIPLGDLKIDFERIGATIQLRITDFTTGRVTTIDIPAPAA